MAQLEQLLVDGDEVDRELVGAVLSPYIRIDKSTGALIPTDAWSALSAQGQILVFLIAQKARKVLGIPGERADFMPAHIEAGTGLVGGTVRSSLNRLMKRRLVDRRKGGGYFVPNWALQRVREALIDHDEA